MEVTDAKPVARPQDSGFRQPGRDAQGCLPHSSWGLSAQAPSHQGTTTGQLAVTDSPKPTCAFIGSSSMGRYRSMPCPVVTASIRVSEGESLAVQARHDRLRVTAGASQERIAHKTLGQQGCCWWFLQPRPFPATPPVEADEVLEHKPCTGHLGVVRPGDPCGVQLERDTPHTRVVLSQLVFQDGREVVVLPRFHDQADRHVGDQGAELVPGGTADQIATVRRLAEEIRRAIVTTPAVLHRTTRDRRHHESGGNER